MEDLAPPPPPLSPPPPVETTTIGKYIARFRYEKPQPREARVAAHQSEFWWTKSPRYSRSPSPPSTWASNGVFFEELSDDLAVMSEEGNTKIEEDNDSVESTLRRRLGLCSASEEGMSDTREELKPKTPEVMQSWDSEEWGSVDIEEEDPDEVIERVRKRLGWSAMSGGPSTLKPIEFQLSTDSNRDSGQKHWEMKPPLSPPSYRQEETFDSLGFTSSSSQSERGCCERFEESPQKEKLISGEAAKALDSLVSSVLHDWENEFYSFPESGSEVEEVLSGDSKPDDRTESRDGPNTIACPPTTPPNEKLPTIVKNSSGNEEFSSVIQLPNTAVSTAENTSQETRLSDVTDEKSACNSDKRGFEVSVEDNDEIVQMLLGRIALLEEALRHIDS